MPLFNAKNGFVSGAGLSTSTNGTVYGGTYNIRSYGAIGDGHSHSASSTLGITSVATLAVQYPWITSTLFQYSARLMVTAETPAGSIVVPVVSSLNVPANGAVAGPGIAGSTVISVAPVVTTVTTTTANATSANATVYPPYVKHRD